MTSPWPGLAMEDSKGDLIGMLEEVLSATEACREGEDEETEKNSGIVAAVGNGIYVGIIHSCIMPVCRHEEFSCMSGRRESRGDQNGTDKAKSE